MTLTLTMWPWPWPCDLDLDMWPWNLVRSKYWNRDSGKFLICLSIQLFFHSFDLEPWPWPSNRCFISCLFVFCFTCYRFQKKKISKSVLHETGFSVRQNCIKSGVREGNSSFISKVNKFQTHLTFKNLENIQEKTYIWKKTVIVLKT